MQQQQHNAAAASACSMLSSAARQSVTRVVVLRAATAERTAVPHLKGHDSCSPLCSWLPRWWLRQVAQKLWPHGSSATHWRSVCRQIWQRKSSSVDCSAVV